MPRAGITLILLSLLAWPGASRAPAHGGVHPTNLDLKEDAILELAFFLLTGDGVQPGPVQDPLETQDYKIINSSEPGDFPEAIVKVGWALGWGHQSGYSDYTAYVRIGNRLESYPGREIPSQFVINPLLDGWKGTVEVELKHHHCDLSFKARAHWNLSPPKCSPCKSLTCQSKLAIGSVEVDVPVGPAWYGTENVALSYRADTIANAGTAALTVSGRTGDQGAEIEKSGGLIQWVTSGGQHAEIFSTPTAHDPAAFEIRVSSDPLLPGQTVFRTTRIESSDPANGPPSLVVTENTLGHVTTRTFTSPNADTWVLVENDLRRTTRTTTSETETTRVRLHQVEERDASGQWQTVSLREEQETMFSWGWETTRETIGPEGRALTTTWDFYRYDESSGPGDSVSGRGQLSRVEFPTGLIRTFEYHDSDPLDPSFDRLTVTREHFAGSEGARETRRHSTRINTTLNERIESLVHDTLISRTDIEARSNWRIESRYDGISATPLVTRYELDHRAHTPLARKTIFPDGSIEEVHEVYTGALFTKTVFTGVPNPTGYPLPILTGEETKTVTDSKGQLVQWSKRTVRDGTAVPLTEAVAVSHDTLLRPTAFDTYHGGHGDPTYREEITYGCCGISSILGADGLRNHRYYDGLGRVFKTHRNGIAHETVFDGLATHHHRYPEAVPNTLPHAQENNRVASEFRDLAGLTNSIESLSPADASWITSGITTEFQPASGIGRRQTTTLPAVADDLGVPATIVEEWFTDGSPASISGSAVPDRQFQYAATAAGLELTDSFVADDTSLRETTTTSFDWLNRPTTALFSGDADGDGQADRQTLEYDSDGMLWRTTDPDGVTTLIDYDLLQETLTTALDLDRDGVINPAVDNVSFIRSGPGQDDSGDTTRWSEQGVIAPDGSEQVLARTETSSDGLATWIDRFPSSGAPPLTTISTPVTGSPGSWDRTVWQPDQTSAVLRIRGGLATELEAFDAKGQSLSQFQYTFDPWQRLTRVTDVDGPDLENHYLAPLVDVVSRQSAGSTSTDYTYDHRGRLVETDRPDTVAADGSTVENRRTSSYWPHDGLRSITGTPGTARSFTWDHAHRLESLTTAGTETPTTQWFRDPDRGWLTAKRYPGQSLGSASGPNFTHTAAGRPKTRTDARGVVTTWNYDNGGRIQSVGYSDNTSPVTITARDHHGRPTGIADAGGPTTISYSATGQAVGIEHQPGHLMAGWAAGSPLDQLDRLASLQILHNGETRQQLFYQYDDAGRLSTVESPRIGARYDYLPGTRLVRQLAISDPLGPVTYDTRSYDHDRRLDRRTVHNGNLDGDFHAFADYQFERDQLGRIESASIGDGTAWDYRYHPSGALAEANRSRQGTVLPGHRFRWSHDARGNLLETSRQAAPASPTTFQPNQLDQFTAIHRPGEFSIFGEAPQGAEVTVNEETAQRDGPFFHHRITPPDPGNPSTNSILVQSGSDSISGSLHFPPVQFNPTHDANGNLLGDGIQQFTWDAENRLQQVETTTAATTAGIPYSRITYTYDHRSRMLARQRFDSPSATTPAESTRFLHSGWRCLGEINAGEQLTRSLGWGLDSASNLHLGDPNGSLLWLHDHDTDTRLVTHADPQGHIAGLIDSHSRQSVASYLHSPFGETLAATGPAAATNPWRFSSHFTDPDTNLTHFGYRWLHPTHQRWLSRDPLGESESPNLYTFVGNDPVNHHDLLGGARRPIDANPYSTADESIQLLQDHWLAEKKRKAAATALKLVAAGLAEKFLVEECPENIAYNEKVIREDSADQTDWRHRPREEYQEAVNLMLLAGLTGEIAKPVLRRVGGYFKSLRSARNQGARTPPSVKTAEDNSAFWSGRAGANREAAEESGLTILEKTHAGRLLDEEDLFSKMPYDQAVVQWEKLSGEFAAETSGTVHAWVGGSSPATVWNRTELPTLLRNPLVRKIIILDATRPEITKTIYKHR